MIFKFWINIRIISVFKYPDISDTYPDYPISAGYRWYYIRIWYPPKISVLLSVSEKKSGYPSNYPDKCSYLFGRTDGRINIRTVFIHSGGWRWTLVFGNPSEIQVCFTRIFFYLVICVFSAVWLLVWALGLNHINFVFCLICVICPLKLLECSNGSNHPSCK